MYDKGTYASRLYGDETPTYTGVTATNFFTYGMEDSGTTHYQIGNPYGLEKGISGRPPCHQRQRHIEPVPDLPHSKCCCHRGLRRR